jgi:hypothetical protein
MPDIKDDLVSFLRSNFDPSAISVAFTNSDGIVHADYDGGRDYPQVAVVSADAVVAGGGQTAATGMDAGGGGPIQDRIYLVQMDCWGGVEDEAPYEGSNEHPDAVASELGDEVFDVCFQGTDGSPSGYEWITADPPSEADDTEENPTHHREIVNVRLKWTYTP